MIPPDEDDIPIRDRRQTGDALSWRVGALERGIRDKADNKDIKALEKDIADLEGDVKDLAEEVGSLRRALVIFSLSMIGSACMFLLGILTLIHNGG